MDRGTVNSQLSRREAWKGAYVLAALWAEEFGGFSSVADSKRAAAIFHGMLVGSKNVRTYSYDEIACTIRVMAQTALKAVEDDSLEFEVRSPGYTKWCIAKVLNGDPLGRRVKVEPARRLVMLSGDSPRHKAEGDEEEEHGHFKMLNDPPALGKLNGTGENAGSF